MPSSTLTSKGQTTIPKEVREHLKLQSGDQIDFVIRPDGTVNLRAATVHVRELKGILHRKNMKPLSIDEMNDAIRQRFRAGK
jgi:antitoxin PrlF